MTEKQKTSWVKVTPKELEKIVVKLAKEGVPPEKIGLILRDEHGIPKAKLLGKKINQILKENDIQINSELENITKKVDKLKKHSEKHKHDYSAKLSIMKSSGRINKLKKTKKTNK